MVKIKRITPQTVHLCNKNDNHLGTVNQYEFLDVLVQIKEKQLSGYYIVYNKEKIRIDRNGTLEYYPAGLFDLLSYYYSKLI